MAEPPGSRRLWLLVVGALLIVLGLAYYAIVGVGGRGEGGARSSATEAQADAAAPADGEVEGGERSAGEAQGEAGVATPRPAGSPGEERVASEAAATTSSSGAAASPPPAGVGAASEGAAAGGEEPAATAEDGGRPRRGRLDATAIRSTVREQLGQFRFCFEWQLHRHPELGGRVTMEFEIGPDGSVSRASVLDDALGDETVLRCFQGVVRRMRFPAPEGEGSVTVHYPFVLSASPDAERPEGAPAPAQKPV